MNQQSIIPKSDTKLPDKAIKAIEDILASDETAKITLTKKGIMIYRENLKREYAQS